VYPLINANTYKFKIESRNLYGYSDLSAELEVICSTVPDQMVNPVSSIVGSDVLITWIKPNENGATITAYKIEIRHKDGTYSQEMANCDGT
jgi:hypothetical protein